MSRQASKNQLIVRNLEEEVVQKGKTSLKDLLLAMPDVGEDTDFARIPDPGRDVELRTGIRWINPFRP